MGAGERTNEVKLKVIYLVFGPIMMGVGVSLAISSTLGADSVAYLWDAIAETYGISVGTSNLIFSGVFLLLMIYADRKQIGIGTILSPVIEGIAIDLTAQMIPGPLPVWSQIPCMLLGIVLIAVGSGLYASAELGKDPYIGFTFGFCNKTHTSLTVFRTLLDGVCLLIAVFITHRIVIGPFVSVCLMGLITERSYIMFRNHITMKENKLRMKY